MMKRNVGSSRQLLAILLAMCMLVAAAPISAEGDVEYTAPGNNAAAPAGTVDITPAENKFTVDGRGFVLLETFDNDESTYYVTTTDAYGDMQTISDGNSENIDNPTGKQISYDAYKSDAFLNGDFLTKGNNFTSLGNDDTTYYKLPQGIIDNINRNHVWGRYVNDYRKQNGIPETYTTGVSLLSWTDFTTYAGKLGVRDVFNDSNLKADAAKLYHVRDTNAWGGDSAVVMFGDNNGNTNISVYGNKWGMPYEPLRPAFYLKKNFFKTTKINLASMGDNVKTAIRAACTDEELIGLYGIKDCKEYFGMEIDLSYIELSLRSGKNIDNAELLDTVVATAENADVHKFSWEISDDGGSNWQKIEKATGDSFVLTAEYAGKALRCTAVSNGAEISSPKLMIPKPVTKTPERVNLDTFEEKTPGKYRFTVDGKGFVLLDSFDNDESAFYVTTTDAYGDMTLFTDGDFENPTGKQINYDAYKSDAFLNGDFLTKGNNYSNLGNESGTYYKLPQGIIDNINKDHVWWRFVNDYRKQNGIPETYTTGVSFLSWTDFTEYAGKFGLVDVFYDPNVKGANVYFLRDTNNWGGDSALTVFGTGKHENKCIFIGQYVEAAGLLRPAFYLKNDFFKNVKLDLSQTGDAVLSVMRGRYTIEDLTDIYSEQELIEHGFTHRYSMQATYTLYNSTQKLESLEGATSLQANVTIRNRGNSDTEATLLMGVYNEKGKRIKLVKEPVTLKAGCDTDSIIAIQELPAGVTSDYKVSVMLWGGVKEMGSLAGSRLTFGDRGDINGNTLKIESDAVGNIFTNAEDAKIKVNSSAGSISYRITDYDNNLVKAETVNTNNHFAVLDLNGLDVGYYEVAVQNGDVFDENAKKKLAAVAIIPEFNFSGVTDSPFGVNTHFELNWLGWNINTIPLLQKAGVKSVRDGYEWNSMESEVKGEYKNYNFFPLEQARLREAGIDYLYVAGSHNKFYDNGASPYTDEGIQGLANYAKKATELYNYYYGDYKLKYMEMYNEWYTAAGDKGDGPADSDPKNYIKVFQKMYETVKAEYPNMTMFLNLYPGEENSEGLLELGGLDYCNGYALHHYNYAKGIEDPENTTYGLVTKIDEMRESVAKYNTDNKDLKFWISEFGWPSITVRWSDTSEFNITDKEQAEYLVRGYAIALSKGVERVYWYDFMNDRDRNNPYDDGGEHKTNGEYNYGLIRNGFDTTYGAHTPKRSYVAYANITRELANKHFVNLDKADDGTGTAYHYHFDGSSGKTAIAYYAVLDGNEEKPSKDVTITANEAVVVKNIEGKIIKTASAGTDITLSLSSSPVYIEGGYTVKQ